MRIVGICLGGYVGGLILAQYLELAPWLGFSLCGLLLGTLFVFRCRWLFIFSLLLFSLLTGLIRYPLLLAPDAASLRLERVGHGPVRLAGRVFAVHERQNHGVSVDLVLDSVRSKEQGLATDSHLRLYIDRGGSSLRAGDRVVFRSRVKRTHNFAIPGEFDFTRQLAYQRIWFTAYLADTRGLAFFRSDRSDLTAIIGALRQSGLRIINKAVGQDRAALLKALLLGEKGSLPKELRQQIAAGGVAHLFAISGLHLGLLAFFFYTFLKYLYSRSVRLLLWQPPVRVLWGPVLLPLFIYLMLTGDALATRRAFCLLLIAALLCLLRRRTSPVYLLVSLAFLFLLFEPLALWQPSFLLSFSGAGGILLWHKPLSKLLQSWPRGLRYLLQLFGISVAAFIATLPASIYFFHLFAPAGLLSNLLAIPLVSFVALPLGLAGLVITPVVESVGHQLLQISAGTLELVVKLADQIASLPGLTARTRFLSLTENMAVLLVCLALLLGWQYRKALLLLVLALGVLVFAPAEVAGPELIVFSVGQGEAMLLRTQEKNILIDAGGLRSDRFDVGERLLAPALGRLGVKTLDAVVLTHNHPDHAGGMAYLITHFETGEFWTTIKPDHLEIRLQQALTKRHVPVRYDDKPGWNQVVLGGIPDIFLFKAPLAQARTNDQSLCLYYPTNAGGILLTGDLEARGVRSLSETVLPGPVAVLKAPHHGSANSEPVLLIKSLDPEIVVVSAGYANAYHFPSPQLVRQAEIQDISLWRTDLDGTILLHINQQGWQGKHWINGLFH